MKSKSLGALMLVAISAVYPAVNPDMADAQISVSIGIPLPPPIVFAAPPELVVLPGSDVYVAPDLSEDVYFVDGWWWRPWQGHWYRSHSYNSGWSYYEHSPSFYGRVHHGWRDDYRDHRWQGHAWNYERMPQDRVSSNWSSWKSTNYWRTHHGVEGMDDRTRSDHNSYQQPRTGSRTVERSQDGDRRYSQPSAPQQMQRRDVEPHGRGAQHYGPPSGRGPSAPQPQNMEHRGGPPQGHSQHSAQPVNNRGGQSQGHGGGKDGQHGHGAPASDNGHGRH
jgi:hypothetical protein